MAECVYVVTIGEYSAYHIVAIFRTKEDAERCAAALDDGAVEVYPLNPSVVYPAMPRFWLEMARDGQVSGLRRMSAVEETTLGPHESTLVLDRQTSMDGKTISCDCLRLSCYARDEQHAIKIANDLRAQVLALDMWAQLTKQEVYSGTHVWRTPASVIVQLLEAMRRSVGRIDGLPPRT